MGLNKSHLMLTLPKLAIFLPGSMVENSQWFFSPWTFFSVFALSLTVVNAVLGFINCPGFHEHGKMKDNSTQHNPDFDRQEVVVEIVIATSRIFGFLINFLVRLIVLIGFPRIRAIVHCLTSPKRNKSDKAKWNRAWLKWSKYEKIYFGIIIVSLLEREIGTIGHIKGMLEDPAMTAIQTMGIILQEQSEILFSLESVLEIATFGLLAFVGMFINLFTEELNLDSGEMGETQTNEVENQVSNLPSCSSSTLVWNKSMMKVPQELFIVPHQSGGFSSKIESTWSDMNIKIGGNASENSLLDLEFLFRDQKVKKSLITYNKGERVERYRNFDEEIQRVIGSYFEIIAVWRHAEGLTGFLTLIIFVELTLMFCLNMFMGLASTSRFGVDSRLFCAIIRASIIVVKMVCVANMAQTLPDSTKLLADKILSLRWQSVQGKERSSRVGEHDNSPKPFNSEFATQSHNDMLSKENSLSQIISYIADNPLKLSALGYFQVSKSSLTSIAGVIVTYLVVLIQFHVQLRQSPPLN